MKKVLAIFASVLIAAAAHAQTNTGSAPATTTTVKTHNDMHHSHMMGDCVMMKDNKMWVKKGGKTMNMEKDMTMKNGAMCSTSGMCTMKDGKTMQMKNGDCMDMNGKMVHGTMHKDMKASDKDMK